MARSGCGSRAVPSWARCWHDRDVTPVPTQHLRDSRVGRRAVRTGSWPWFLASVWLCVLALSPAAILDAFSVWVLWRTPMLYLVPSAGGHDVPAWPGVLSVLPTVSLLAFLTALALPFLAVVTFSLATACIARPARQARVQLGSLGAVLLAVVLAPWLITIRLDVNLPTPASPGTDLLALFVFVALSAALLFVAYAVIGSLAFQAAQPQFLPPAGWYDDPASVSRLRWWSGSEWTHLSS